MNTVQERLQMTETEYSDLLFNIWLKWCAARTANRGALQKVLICQPLKNWWECEMAKYEAEFLEASEPYASTITKNDALKLWAEHTIQIYNRFSKPLMKKAYERITIEQQN